MGDKLPAGPYRTIELGNGIQTPFYIIPFDEQGRCQAPLTRDQLLATLQNEAYTDIFLFSHGWNNDWQMAISSYENFLNGYAGMRRKYELDYLRPFQPLLIGIFWPSVALVLPWESGPAFAGFSAGDSQLTDMQVGQEREEIQSIATTLPPQDVERSPASTVR